MTSELSGLWAELHADDADGPPATDRSRRRVVVVLLDTSFSMALPAEEDGPDDIAAPRRIDMLNARLREWLPKVQAAGREELDDVEVAVLTFGGEGVRAISGDASGPIGRWHEDYGVFRRAADLDLDLNGVEASGTTHMVTAVDRALDLGEARVRHLAMRKIKSEPIRMLMFGDGGTYDKDVPGDAWQSLLTRLRVFREQHRLQFFAFGPPGADKSSLEAMAGADGYVPLAEFDFERLLDLIFRATSANDPLTAIRREFGWEEPRT